MPSSRDFRRRSPSSESAGSATLGELEPLGFAESETIGVARPCHDEQDGVAVAATHHDSGRLHVRVLRPDVLHLAASAACDLGGRHLLHENLAEHARHRVAVDTHLIALHRYPPVGPNRSVLTPVGGYPRSTRAAATDSTNGVGPHTNADDPAETGQAVSASIAPSTRRAYPVHPDGCDRVKVWKIS